MSCAYRKYVVANTDFHKYYECTLSSIGSECKPDGCENFKPHSKGTLRWYDWAFVIFKLVLFASLFIAIYLAYK